MRHPKNQGFPMLRKIAKEGNTLENTKTWEKWYIHMFEEEGHCLACRREEFSDKIFVSDSEEYKGCWFVSTMVLANYWRHKDYDGIGGSISPLWIHDQAWGWLDQVN